jgi:hypothetical protein
MKTSTILSFYSPITSILNVKIRIEKDFDGKQMKIEREERRKTELFNKNCSKFS